MKTFVLIMLFLLHYPAVVFSQIVISGRITAVPGNKIAPYVNVRVKNSHEEAQSHGLNGVFRLYIESFKPGMVLVFSGIGYKRKEIILDKVPEKSLNIKMEYSNNVKDAQFRKKTIRDPYKILNNAIKNIKKNYDDKPFIIEGLYQDIFQDYDHYKNLHTSSKSVSVYSRSFDALIDPQDITIISGKNTDDFWSKVYYDNDNMLLPQYKIPNYGGNHLLCLLNHDLVRNHARENMSFVNSLGTGFLSRNDFISNHEFRIHKLDYYNGELAYYIKIIIAPDIWMKYMNIIHEPLINNQGIYLNHGDFYPSFTNGRTVTIYTGMIVINAKDFGIVKFEYHNGYLHDRYKFGIEYKKTGSHYYPSNIYLGNKCFINKSFSFSPVSNYQKGTIQCLGGIKYFNELTKKYSKTAQDENIINEILKENTLHTPNTSLISRYESEEAPTTYGLRTVNSLRAYSKALEDILYAFKLKDYDKLLHHRILRVSKVVKPRSGSSGKHKVILKNTQSSEFNNSFKYIGDKTFDWYASYIYSQPFNFSFKAKLNRPSQRYYFPIFPIPVTSVDEYRYIFPIPKVEYLTDKNHLIKGKASLRSPYVR